VVGAHTARVGGKNKLARKENTEGPNAHTPRRATSVWPVSDVTVSRPVAGIGTLRDQAGGHLIPNNENCLLDKLVEVF
jgi:hypothetical protein